MSKGLKGGQSLAFQEKKVQAVRNIEDHGDRWHAHSFINGPQYFVPYSEGVVKPNKSCSQMSDVIFAFYFILFYFILI